MHSQGGESVEWENHDQSNGDHWLASSIRFSIECVRSCDRKPYLHNETKGEICIKIEFNPQKNISLLQDGRRLFVYTSNMAAVTSTLADTCWYQA